ncbi:GNAT family N-acetyltransferase [Shimazuella kribbensis]|uniref:GNAT family N-acetyltransferase n=1 Tax=Shimazuella kribbensis TaxID=139808 RepID=UPI000416B562|nr:GNAT family N-acetyltransferase [Shimazuella kribbensis]
MLTFRTLSECTLHETIQVWNEGFDGYFVPIKFDEATLISHLFQGDISPTLSFIALLDGKPAGIVLNAVREINGKKIAWNGGTGVTKAYRGSGIGQAMIHHSIQIYKENHVELATLEALEQNESAIRLYKKMGYQETKTLHYHSLSNPSSIDNNLLPSSYKLSMTNSQEIRKIPFYEPLIPWQTQITNKTNREAVILWNEYDQPIGYASFQKVYNLNEDFVQSTLHHCKLASSVQHKKSLYLSLLSHVFPKTNPAPTNFSYSTSNLLMDNHLKEALLAIGFERKMGQVWMQQYLTQP